MHVLLVPLPRDLRHKRGCVIRLLRSGVDTLLFQEVIYTKTSKGIDVRQGLLKIDNRKQNRKTELAVLVIFYD